MIRCDYCGEKSGDGVWSTKYQRCSDCTEKVEEKERTKKLLKLIDKLGIFNERPFVKKEYRNEFVKEVKKIYD